MTLFASGDSQTTARLSATFPKNIYDILGKFDWSNNSYNLLHARACFDRAQEFDVIHNHLGPEALLFAPFVKTPTITTMHSSLPPDFPELAKRVKDERFVSISDAQRKVTPYFNWISTVYHGLNEQLFSFSAQAKDYLLFIGTLGPTKGVDVAVQIARKLNRKLIIAGDRRPEFENFLAEKVLSYVDGKQIELRGEVDEQEKIALYQNAQAFLFPVRWQEAFGLVVAESMLCGTPVVGFSNGSLAEIVDAGVTGYTVADGDEEGLAAAVQKAEQLDRSKVRARALERFTVKTMADGYEEVYRRVAGER